MIRPILLLGDPALYETSTPIIGGDPIDLTALETDLRDTLLEYRRQYGAGRAIAAPQIGVFRRAIYLHVPTPTLLVDPVLTFPDDEMMENIKKGIEPLEAIEKASGQYGRFDEAVKKIDPRKE